jgi:hypothetical protein
MLSTTTVSAAWPPFLRHRDVARVQEEAKRLVDAGALNSARFDFQRIDSAFCG